MGQLCGKPLAGIPAHLLDGPTFVGTTPLVRGGYGRPGKFNLQVANLT
jgi:hypothetical protein